MSVMMAIGSCPQGLDARYGVDARRKTRTHFHRYPATTTSSQTIPWMDLRMDDYMKTQDILKYKLDYDDEQNTIDSSQSAICHYRANDLCARRGGAEKTIM
jgi:hypothetical protein